MRAAVLLLLSVLSSACCVCGEPSEDAPTLTMAARQLALAPQGGRATWTRVDLPLDQLERIDPELTLVFREGGSDPSKFNGWLRAMPSRWRGVVILTGTFVVEDVRVFVDARDEEIVGGRDGFREWRSGDVTTLIQDGVFYPGSPDELEAALAVRAGKAPSVLDRPGVAEIIAGAGECDAVAINSGAPETSEFHTGIPGLETSVDLCWIPGPKKPLRMQLHMLFESPDAAKRMLPKLREALAGVKRKGTPEMSIRREGEHVTVDMKSVVFRAW